MPRVAAIPENKRKPTATSAVATLTCITTNAWRTLLLPVTRAEAGCCAVVMVMNHGAAAQINAVARAQARATAIARASRRASMDIRRSVGSVRKRDDRLSAAHATGIARDVPMAAN